MKTPPELMVVSPSMEARKARGLTRQELANEQHVSVQFVWLVEKLEANLLSRECFKHFLDDLSIPGDHTYGYCLFRLTPNDRMNEGGATVNQSQIQQRLQEIKAEISALREKLASARESGDVWTARWYAERIAIRDEERRELEWAIH